MTSPIVDFYLHDGKDFKGRTFDQLIAVSDDELERSHDVVQWLFPLNEPSAHSRHAPVLTTEEIAVFATLDGQVQYRRAFGRFMEFYGMKIVEPFKFQNFYLQPDRTHPQDELVENPYDNFTARANVWLTPKNHNLKRITRIIRCAMLLKLNILAARTRDGFSDLARNVELPYRFALDDKVLQFWSDAVNLPLDAPLQVLPPTRIFRL